MLSKGKKLTTVIFLNVSFVSIQWKSGILRFQILISNLVYKKNSTE